MSHLYVQEEGFDFIFDLIAEYIRKSDNGLPRVVNPENYSRMLKFVNEMNLYLNATQQISQVRINIDTVFNSGSVSIETELLSFCKEDGILNMFHLADCVDMYSLVNGNFLLEFTFHKVLKTINIKKDGIK